MLSLFPQFTHRPPAVPQLNQSVTYSLDSNRLACHPTVLSDRRSLHHFFISFTYSGYDKGGNNKSISMTLRTIIQNNVVRTTILWFI